METKCVISEKNCGICFTTVVTKLTDISSSRTYFTSKVPEGFTLCLPQNLYNNLYKYLILLFIKKSHKLHISILIDTSAITRINFTLNLQSNLNIIPTFNFITDIAAQPTATAFTNTSYNCIFTLLSAFI